MATIYKKEMDAGVAGAVVTCIGDNLQSYTVEDVAGLGFGLAVAQGANDKGTRLVKTGDTSDKFIGVSVLDRTAGDLINGKFPQYNDARIMKRGIIWVTVTEDVKANDAAAVDLATGKFNKSGAAFKNAKFRTSAVAGQIAQLEIFGG